MGYTHYWKRTRKTLPRTLWQEFMEVNRRLLNRLPSDITIRGTDGIGMPELKNEYIAVNGDSMYDLDHETLYLSRNSINEGTGFCKTARKPYDLLVCAILINYVHTFNGSVIVTSDGGAEDWKNAAQFYQMVTERNLPPTGPWYYRYSEYSEYSEDN